ncbi:MAG: pseudaminic acid cytidylyltransferase [Sedimenticola sp.]
MTTVAIIPARGGSKRIPRKNIKSFLGRPMISYPIRVLKETGLFDRIIVSTDDQEIADVALEWGAEVPFMRPSDLADDYTGTTDVVKHAVQWLVDYGERPDYVCCAYATSPFLSSIYVQKGWEALGSGKRLVIAMTSFAYPIQRAFRLLDGGGVEPFYPAFIPYRSQDLEPAYHDAGQFYWWDIEALLQDVPGFSQYVEPILLPRHLVQDIDDEEDWLRAELMYRAMQMQDHSCEIGSE